MIKNAEEMREMGIDVRFNCSLTPDNFNDMENIFNVCKQRGFHVKTTPYMYPQIRVNGVYGENKKRLTPEEAAKCRVNWSMLRYGNEEFVSRARGMKRKIEEFKANSHIVNPAQGVVCRAGKTSFWLSKEGKMMPCGMINEEFDVKTLGFAEAWNLVSDYVEKIRTPIECSNCTYRHFCNVCAAVCYTETGSYSEKPEYVCRFSEETARLTQLELERLEKDGY